jgi:hypothetical protein
METDTDMDIHSLGLETNYVGANVKFYKAFSIRHNIIQKQRAVFKFYNVMKYTAERYEDSNIGK